MLEWTVDDETEGGGDCTMRVSYKQGGGAGTENDWCLFSGRQSVDDSTFPNRGIVWG